MAAELTPGGVDSACHPSEVSEMSSSGLVEEHSISGIVVLQQNDSYLARCKICKNNNNKARKQPYLLHIFLDVAEIFITSN